METVETKKEKKVYGLRQSVEQGLAKKHPGGRPRIFQDPIVLEAKIKEYFEVIDIEERPPTIAGLSAHLGLDRQTLSEYAKLPEFSATLKQALNRLDARYQERLITHKGNPAGLIFLGKNHGYTDMQEIKHTHQSIGSVISRLTQKEKESAEIYEGEVVEEESFG